MKCGRYAERYQFEKAVISFGGKFHRVERFTVCVPNNSLVSHDITDGYGHEAVERSEALDGTKGVISQGSYRVRQFRKTRKEEAAS
jgi:hypothetical protein